MNEKILVMGYGNTLRRDDGAGIEVVRRLQERITHPNCLFMTAFQPQPELVMQFIEVDRLIIIDASVTIPPGAIRVSNVSSQPPSDASMTHFLTPEHMLLLCEQLYGYAPITRLFTIGGHDFGYGEGFSAIVSIRLNRLVGRIEAEILKIMERAHHV